MRLRVILIAASVAASTFLHAGGATAARYCVPLASVFPDGVTQLRGDVDGDHRADTVSTSVTQKGDPTCTGWLTVDTARGSFRRRIDPVFGSILAPPALSGLVRVGPGQQLDIAVIVFLGASTGFVDVYAGRGQSLVRASGEAYPYAGSVVNRAGVDCVRRRGADVVASTATFRADNRYHVERSFFAMRGGELRLLPDRTERATVRFNALDRYREFASFAPFPSCTAVAAPS